MKTLFKNEQHQKAFNEIGYTVLPGFLDAQQVETCFQVYKTNFKDTASFSDKNPYFSLAHADEALAGHIEGDLWLHGGTSVDRHFQNVAKGTAGFIIKKASPRNILVPHQDIAASDETVDRLPAVWIPLSDVGLDDGPIGFLKGSHNYFSDVRCSPTFYGRQLVPFFKYERDLMPYMTFPRLGAGDAVVFDSAIIHGSLPNCGKAERVVVSLGVEPMGVKKLCRYLLPGTGFGQYECYEASEKFHREYNEMVLYKIYQEGGRPQGLTSLGVFDRKQTEISFDEMVELMARTDNHFDPELARRARTAFALYDE